MYWRAGVVVLVGEGWNGSNDWILMLMTVQLVVSRSPGNLGQNITYEQPLGNFANTLERFDGWLKKKKK